MKVNRKDLRKMLYVLIGIVIFLNYFNYWTSVEMLSFIIAVVGFYFAQPLFQMNSGLGCYRQVIS
ncbi:ABC-type siderophore export system fused ATPase/permease subunit [Geomicrobium sediminis]|uniref:ABC-type siderophore export system fused ATPase/permease subunit n=1 Tax=Geomicrobium sediminis TaxID=1347788 RepID=A0ABS2PCP6_9BACL|nr:ABC-type siderophore export system fused ATPase/permease subunit [Geomicrobium sediminis]